jgi:thioesterase domain-containing protein
MTFSPTLEIDPVAARDVLREALESALLADIPITQAMQMRISAWDGERLSMKAPLGPNINDKGCAFGGSLASVMTLAGWSLLRLATVQQKIDCDIYVQDSTIRYLAPVWTDFVAEALLDADQSFDEFFSTLQSRGKARLAVNCEIRNSDGAVATSLSGRFVALLKNK